MDVLKVNSWQNISGSTMQAPLKFEYYDIPYTTASVATTGYISSLSGYTTSNTTAMWGFNYSPVSSSSYIMWMLTTDIDRDTNGYQEHLCVFVDNVCYSSSFLYPRTSGNEPCLHHQSGTYTNSNTSTKSIYIRGARGNGGTMYLGKAMNNAQARTMLIWEYPQ